MASSQKTHDQDQGRQHGKPRGAGGTATGPGDRWGTRSNTGACSLLVLLQSQLAKGVDELQNFGEYQIYIYILYIYM